MADKRLEEYRQALIDLRNGKIIGSINCEPDDELSALGREIIRLQKELQELSLLDDLAAKINTGLNLEEVLDRIFDSFQVIIPYDRIGVALLTDDGKNVRSFSNRSRTPIIKLKEGYSARLKNSSLEKIIRTGQPRIINDLEKYLADKPSSASTRLILSEGMLSSLTCPLIIQTKPVGFIFFSSCNKNTYRDAHIELFQKIADQVAVIIEKSRLYQNLAALNDEKTNFLGIAAHDLRSPIGVIKSYADILLAGLAGNLTEQQTNIIKTIENNCTRMLNLINDLLDISAIESGKLTLQKTKVEPSIFFANYAENATRLAAVKSIRFETFIAPEIPPIEFDPNRITQVLDNLVSNAIKFSLPGTTITLTVKATNKNLEIRVADQGQGIPHAEISKLFKPFSRTSVQPTGGEKSTGLGLAIVRRIVQAHNGKIQVKSELGQGTEFIIHLPLTSKKSFDNIT
ncbi:MAG TPA: GAF domain-containing sensor histidine kinase [Candidatus Marinimicrobia bacterium]|nr:GAF domain-containing sensor histidine kinase [Candidatus Neomarinimicrobiota bacterium]HRS51481.1 GAF domain-containing sensor histidine kinase [Candidatus Neomarinimicrobiota bacterium]HRU92751.1 GAF domain-containing sensor histidine kinase [Candidatus Neomarinimicrobiota bacterium]